MSNSKKNSNKSQLSKKKVRDINPREYTIMGTQPSYVNFSPSTNGQFVQPISHSLEKWILMILLAFAMAAFVGFKLLENSDLAFSLSDGTTAENFAAHSVSNDKEFRQEFYKNRQEARGLLEKHTATLQKSPKYGKGTKKYYAKKSAKKSKKIARKSNSKKRIAYKSAGKKAVARR